MSLCCSPSNLAREINILEVADTELPISYMTSLKSLENLLNYQLKHNSLENIENKTFPFQINKINREQYLKIHSNFFVPAALELTIQEKEAEILECNFIIEGSNGPVSNEAEEILKSRNIPIIPDILCNSGGVIVSYFEWEQNKINEQWTEDKVFEKLDNKMIHCYQKIKENCESNYDWRIQCYKYSIEKLFDVYSLRKSYLFD